MQPKTDLQTHLERAALIVKPTPTKYIERQLISNGVDHVFYIDISKKESLRRALGRRLDPGMGVQYHLDDNVPPIDNSPLVEKLEEIASQDSSDLAIVEKNCQLDLSKGDLKNLYEIFGYKLPLVKKNQQPESQAPEREEHQAEPPTDKPAGEEEEADQQKEAPAKQAEGQQEQTGAQKGDAGKKVEGA